VKPRSHKQESLAIVYDADRVTQPGPELFDREYWEGQGRVVGQAQGRGSALLLETPFGAAVLRQYLRGGWPAQVSDDLYLYTGFERSRPLREFHMLARLVAMGLPVPAPLAAMCARHGAFYRGWLLMQRILPVTTLAESLVPRMGDSALWRATGAAIRRFHGAGVVHADLNARNILVGENDAIHLIDFDRARISVGDDPAFTANLKRLRRSLDKLWPEAFREHIDACWSELLAGYGTDGERA
jgi:3-deoxy-D-manno-octulosonic acid kinase